MSEYIKGKRRILSEEEIRNVMAKYKVGDIVVYIDNNNDKKVGAVKEIEWTDISEWNHKSNPLYLIDGCEYLRKQSDIIKPCEVVTPKYIKRDRVYYIDVDGEEKMGVVQKVYETYISDWNNIIEPLYIIGSSLHLRSERDITGFYVDEAEDCIEDYIGI